MRSISGKIWREFFDIAHGRSWQNFSKSEQEKLRGKLDSANFNFRLPQSNAFARVLLSVLDRHPVVKPTRRWAGAERGADIPSRMRHHHEHP